MSSLDPSRQRENSRTRSSSVVIARFPWYTRQVVHGGDFEVREADGQGGGNDDGLDFTSFFRRLNAFEKQTFSSQALDKRLSQYRRAIQFHESGSDDSRAVVLYDRPQIDELQARMTCNILALYRLSEIPHVLESRRLDAVPHPRTFLPKPKLQAWSQLEDWPSLLLQTHDAFAKKLGDSQTGHSSTPGSEPGKSHLLKILVQLTAQDHVNKVTLNFIVAALYMSAILTSRDEMEAGPPLQDLDATQALDLVEQQLSSRSAYNESLSLDEADLKVLSRAEILSPHIARLPLLVALLISPICLLLASKLVQKNTWNRQDLYETAWALGNQKPDSLVQCEQILIRLLLRLTVTRWSLEKIVWEIKETLAKLPLAELRSMADDDPDRFWFRPGPGVASRNPLIVPLGASPSIMPPPAPLPSVPLPPRTSSQLPVVSSSDEESGQSLRGVSMSNGASELPAAPSRPPSRPEEEVSKESGDDVRGGRVNLDASLQSQSSADPEQVGQDEPEKREAERGEEKKTQAEALEKLAEGRVNMDLDLDLGSDAGLGGGRKEFQEERGEEQEGEELADPLDRSDDDMLLGSDLGDGEENGPRGGKGSDSEAIAGAPGQDASEADPPERSDDDMLFGSDLGDGEESGLSEGGRSDSEAIVGAPGQDASGTDSDYDEEVKKKRKRKPKKDNSSSKKPKCDPSSKKPKGTDDSSSKKPKGNSSKRNEGDSSTKKAKGNALTKQSSVSGAGGATSRSKSSATDVSRETQHGKSKSFDDEEPAMHRQTVSSIDHEVHPIAQSEFWLPFTVDPFEDKKNVTLDTSTTPPIFEGKEVLAYGPLPGDVLCFVPRFHDKKTLDRFEIFQKAIDLSIDGGVPLHIRDPERSVFKVMTETEFLAMTPSETQAILRTKCIVITDRSQRPLTFDENGLRTLGALHKVVTIQDHSLADTDNGNNRRREGTTYQVLKCSKKKNHKILNCLQFPRAQAGYEFDLSINISTDGCAWVSTEGSVDCKEGLELPVSDMRWGLLALNGAIHFIHIDSDGLGTFIDPKTGAKYWIILKPKKTHSLANIGFFYVDGFDLDDPSIFDVEAILIRPGTTLVMPPTMPHAVYTPEHAICWGGHYYSTGTMQATFLGIVHAFMAGKYITNTSHPASRLLLRRIACFYYQALIECVIPKTDPLFEHVPPLTSIDSALDFLSLCSLMYLGNALDPQTYLFPTKLDGEAWTEDEEKAWFQDDLNSMPKVDRKRWTYARGIARELLSWFIDSYKLTFNPNPAPDSYSTFRPASIQNFALSFIAHQLVAVKAYKQIAHKKEPQTSEISSCSAEMFAHQVDGCFPVDDPLRLYKRDAEAELLKTPITTMGFIKNKHCYHLAKVNVPRARQRKALSYTELDRLGRSQRDTAYYSYLDRKESAIWVKMEGVN